MKKIQIILIVLVILTLTNCETRNADVHRTDVKINGKPFSTYIIDSCEYIGYIHSSQSDVITHKGNCKFCINRNKK